MIKIIIKEISNESVTDAFSKDQITRAVKTSIGSKQVSYSHYLYITLNIYIYILSSINMYI